jgi:hypothetical protein
MDRLGERRRFRQVCGIVLVVHTLQSASGWSCKEFAGSARDWREIPALIRGAVRAKITAQHLHKYGVLRELRGGGHDDTGKRGANATRINATLRPSCSTTCLMSRSNVKIQVEEGCQPTMQDAMLACPAGIFVRGHHVIAQGDTLAMPSCLCNMNSSTGSSSSALSTHVPRFDGRFEVRAWFSFNLVTVFISRTNTPRMSQRAASRRGLLCQDHWRYSAR